MLKSGNLLRPVQKFIRLSNDVKILRGLRKLVELMTFKHG